jgi:uncharacterized protein (TIGR00369 family)
MRAVRTWRLPIHHDAVNLTTMTRLNPEYIQRVKAQMCASPYPRHMSMTLDELSPGACTVRLALADKHLQPFGIVHGGVIATLIDTATFWAVFLGLHRSDDGLVNVDLKLNYLAPAVAEGALIATGEQVRMGRRIGYSQAHVHNEDGELIAHGTSTLMALPGKGLKLDVPREL